MRRSLTLTALLGMLAAMLAVPVASASTAAPAIPPAEETPYAGGGAANLLEVHAEANDQLADLQIADVILSPASTTVDSTSQNTADAANLDAQLLGALPLDGILSEASQTAPPDNAEPTENTLIPLEIPSVLDLGVSTSSAHARFPGAGECLAPGEPLSRAFNETAGADVLPLDGLFTVATVNNETGGVSGTRSTVTTAEVAGEEGRALVSTSETQVDAITLFAGSPQLEVTIGVAATPTLTAVANGQPGGATVSYNDPLVTISAPDTSVFNGLEIVGDTLNTTLDGVLEDLLPEIAAILKLILGDDGLGVINIDITTGTQNLVTETAPDGTGAAGTVSVVSVAIEVLPLLNDVLGAPLLSLTADVGPMSALAAVPVGGINCTPDVPECSDGGDNDGDGFTDIEDPNCHTDGNPYNPDSYDPNDDDESGPIPECVDAVDNDDDQVSDMDDPGCHTDGDPNNPDSFDPTDDREAEDAPPAGPLPKTGDDVPLAAALLVGGLGLVALQLMRRRRIV